MSSDEGHDEISSVVRHDLVVEAGTRSQHEHVLEVVEVCGWIGDQTWQS